MHAHLLQSSHPFRYVEDDSLSWYRSEAGASLAAPRHIASGNGWELHIHTTMFRSHCRWEGTVSTDPAQQSSMRFMGLTDDHVQHSADYAGELKDPNDYLEGWYAWAFEDFADTLVDASASVQVLLSSLEPLRASSHSLSWTDDPPPDKPDFEDLEARWRCEPLGVTLGLWVYDGIHGPGFDYKWSGTLDLGSYRARLSVDTSLLEVPPELGRDDVAGWQAWAASNFFERVASLRDRLSETIAALPVERR